MGKTSNAAKQRWNSENYAQVKVSVPKELAAEFRAKCKVDGVSMASKIAEFMNAEIGGSKPAKTPKDSSSTRPMRRKELKYHIDCIAALADQERNYMENIPENLQNSCRYEAAEHSVTAMEDGVDILSEAY